jgi:prepilin-type N-terminal cleavage/methylation domain-containing protein
MTRASDRAGFTLVEAMISMVVLAVGVLGMMAMQTGSVAALAASQDLTQVHNVGERMLELLRLDALRWNDPSTLTTSTVLLKGALPPAQNAGSQGNWATIPNGVLVPEMAGKKVDRDFRPYLAGQPWAVGFRYCVYYRLTWAIPPTTLRADVRVAWPKDEGDRSKLVDCVTDAASVIDTANVKTATFSTVLSMNVP